MEELGELVGALIGVVLLIVIIVWLIVIAIAIAIGITVVVGPPLGLGTILKQFLTKRYALSERKRWQCAGVASLAFAVPFLALIVDSSLVSCLMVAWAGTVMGMSSLASFLAISAYQQHFAQHRRSIREARATLIGERFRHKIATLKLWRTTRALERVERQHGHQLRAQVELAAQIDALIESNDPALCRIKMSHWESQYSALSARQLVDELSAVRRETATAPEAQQPAVRLQSLFLEMQVRGRKVAGEQTTEHYYELKAARDQLQAVTAACAGTMDECRRVETEKTAKIAQLKSQRLVIE